MKPPCGIAVVIVIGLHFVMAFGDVQDSTNSILGGSQMIEEGRTAAHHAVKRLQILLPFVFFKLGVAFALLVLAAAAAVGNGMLGVLLLVVGLAGLLSRLQPPARIPTPFTIHPYHHLIDRSDDSSPVRVPGVHHLINGRFPPLMGSG